MPEGSQRHPFASQKHEVVVQPLFPDIVSHVVGQGAITDYDEADIRETGGDLYGNVDYGLRMLLRREAYNRSYHRGLQRDIQIKPGLFPASPTVNECVELHPAAYQLVVFRLAYSPVDSLTNVVGTHNYV